jgi:ERCC4-type nuclease
MNYKLVVDYREAHVRAELDKLGIPYQVENLDIGDYQIRGADGARGSDTVIGIWERKTYSDLASSICDSRYGEQKHRLTTSDARYKGYIIEGVCPDPTRKYHSLQAGAVESIKIGLTCRDGFNVLYSLGTSHTAIILGKLLKKLPEYITEDRSTEALEQKYHSALVQSSVSSVKRENFTQETCYLAQLSQLPQVSLLTAKVLGSRWGNMGTLTAAIVADRTGTKDIISELKVGGRRIGESISLKIVDYLVPEPKKVIVKKKTAL